MHPLPAPGAIAGDQRREHPLREDRAGRGVGDRDTDARRTGAGRARDAHHTAEALRDLVDTRTACVRAVLTEARDARVHQPRVHPPEGVGIDAQPVLHRGAKVLDEHVGVLDEAHQHRVPLVGREVDDHRALVAVEVRSVGAAGCKRDRSGGWAHLHDVGTEVGKLANACGPGPRHREIDHTSAVERTGFHALASGDRRDTGDHHDEAERHVRDGARRPVPVRARASGSGSPGCGPGSPVAPAPRWWHPPGRRREGGGAAPRGSRRTTPRRPR